MIALTRSKRRDLEKRTNKVFFQKAIRDLQRTYLLNKTARAAKLSKMSTTFILNPYDQELDLTKKDHLRLYLDGCTGLKEEVPMGRLKITRVS